MIILLADHAGFELKTKIKESISTLTKEQVIDLVTIYDEQDDYPDIVLGIRSIKDYQTARIIAVCGSGQGICMALNKIPLIRAGIGYSSESAKLMRIDNNANALCLSGREQSIEEVLPIIKIFLTTEFSTHQRHHRRVQKLDKLLKIYDN